MIKVYFMSVKPLYAEKIYEAACTKLDASRLEKVNGAKRAEDKILRVGAGLLLQYAVQKSPVFDYVGGTLSSGEMHSYMELHCDEVSVGQVLNGIREPIEFEFTYGPHGKPYFKGNMFFSLSHSGEYVLCALSDMEIGTDIQKIPEETAKRREREKQIAKKFFTKREQMWYLGQETQERDVQDVRRHFYRIWAAKEAYMKWTGNGLSEGISTFEVDLEKGIAKDSESGEVRARLCEVEVPKGYAAMVSWVNKDAM